MDDLTKRRIVRMKNKGKENVYENIIDEIINLETDETYSFEIADLKAERNGLIEDEFGIISIGVKRIREFDSDIILFSDYGTGVFAIAFGLVWKEEDIKAIIEKRFRGYGFVDAFED
ncbi:hypothetical protein [Desulfosporosinus burensis]